MASLKWGTADFVEANVDRLRLTAKKDGVAWSGIDAITLTFENPDRTTQFSRSMILENDITGVWYYDTVVTDFTDPGYWTVRVRITDGDVVKDYPVEISLKVIETP